jgi:cytochrome c556
MRRVTFVALVLALLLGVPTLSGHGGEPKKDDKLHELMQRKLAASQKVLEGIAVNDFDKIGKQADELIAVSKQAEWRVQKTPQFELHSNDFRRIADNLAQNAKDKNLDGAALNYVELTLTCVKCHKYIRERRDTAIDGPGH